MCLAKHSMGEQLYVPITEKVPTSYSYTTHGYDVETSVWSDAEKCNSSSSNGSQTTGVSRLSKADDPLEDPQVNGALLRLQVTGNELINMSVKELNKRLADCPNNIVAKLKRCRRTVKNRGYAKNCRTKRLEIRDKLVRENDRLSRENHELHQSNRSLLYQLNELRSQSYVNHQPLYTIHTSLAPTIKHSEQMSNHYSPNTTTTVCQQSNNNSSIFQLEQQQTVVPTITFGGHSSEAEHLADMIAESMVSDDTLPPFTHVQV